jgi:hypothetical protein
MWGDELEVFARRHSLQDLAQDEHGVARASLEGGACELFIDASRNTCASIYVLFPMDRPSVATLLHGLQLCEPARVVGHPIHCVSDGGSRVGFLINLDAAHMHADAMAVALAQILQTMIRMLHG